jgi:hypothetical protein
MLMSLDGDDEGGTRWMRQYQITGYLLLSPARENTAAFVLPIFVLVKN